MKLRCQSSSEERTKAVGAVLATHLGPDGVLLLRGEMGAGKTVLAQGVARGLGVDERQVQSPTFTLMREHDGPGGRMIHVDLYRLSGDEIEAIGLWETLAGPGLKVVEWSERLSYEVPEATRVTLLGAASRASRELWIETEGENEELRRALEELELRESGGKEE